MIVPKTLAIFAIAAVIAIGVSGQPNDASHPKQAISGQANPSVIPANAPHEHPNSAANQPEAGSDPPPRDAATERPRWWAIPDWWLVIIAGLTGGAIFWQSLLTRRAANAALLNAQAVINAERAWLTVVVTDELSSLPDLPRNRIENGRRQMRRVLTEMNVPLNGEEGICHVSIQNQGRTPAKVIGGSSSHCFVDRPDNLPLPPDYSSPFFLPDPTFIVNGESFMIHPGFKPEFILERDGRHGTKGGATEFLIFFGRIVYEDVFALPDGSSGTHETRWCFVYRPGQGREFTSGGPSDYSGHT